MILLLRGKRLGFSLREVKEYLDLYDRTPTQIDQIRLLRDRVRCRILQLEEQRRALDLTLGELQDIERQADEALSRLS